MLRAIIACADVVGDAYSVEAGAGDARSGAGNGPRAPMQRFPPKRTIEAYDKNDSPREMVT
jgi:hypothetical protein